MKTTLLLIALWPMALILMSRFGLGWQGAKVSSSLLHHDPVQTTTSSGLWFLTLAAVTRPHLAGAKDR